MGERISDKILEKINNQKNNRHCKIILSQKEVPKNDIISNKLDAEDLIKIKQTKKIPNSMANGGAKKKPSQKLTFEHDEFDAFARYFESINNDNSVMSIVTTVDSLPFVNVCDLFEEVRPPTPSRLDEIQNIRPPDVKGHNPDILFAAPSLRILTTPDRGRHLITKTQIDRNEVLISEKVSVLQVNPLCNCDGDEYKQYRCHYCAAVCFKFYVCNYCNIVTYCSQDCLNLARQQFHKYECEGLQTHFWSMEDTDYSYISFRTMLYGALHNFDTNVRDNVGYGSTKNNYPYVYQLKTYFDKLPVWKIYTILEASTRTLIYLIYRTEFFKRFPVGSTHYMYKYIGGLLVRHHCQALYNSVLIRYPNISEGYGFNYIGGFGKAICPVIALLNHACSPNAVIIPYGDRMVVKSMKTILEDEEITICYQEVDAFYDLYERNLITSELYNFTCTCSLCSHERIWERAPYSCTNCANGRARKVCQEEIIVAICEVCNNYFELAQNVEKSAAVCIKLYRSTFEIDHLLRIAECYDRLYQRNSWMLLDVYRLLFEKFVNWGEKPLEIIKYGIMTFTILEQYVPKLYRPLLEAKINFYFAVIRNDNLWKMRRETENDRKLLLIFSTQVHKTKRDLTFYVPTDFIDVYTDNLVKKLEKLEKRLAVSDH